MANYKPNSSGLPIQCGPIAKLDYSDFLSSAPSGLPVLFRLAATNSVLPLATQDRELLWQAIIPTKAGLRPWRGRRARDWLPPHMCSAGHGIRIHRGLTGPSHRAEIVKVGLLGIASEEILLNFRVKRYEAGNRCIII